jgi:hypothetical protein
MRHVPFDELPDPERRLMSDAMENWQSRAREWPYPTLGLVEPAPWPRLILQIGETNGRLTELCLCFGDPDPDIETGPRVSVYHNLPPTRQSVDWHVGVRTWPSRERQKLPAEDTEVIIDGVAVPGRMVSHRDSVGVECAYDALRIAVIARAWSRWPIELEPVADISLFVRGREEYLEGYHRRQPPPPQ